MKSLATVLLVLTVLRSSATAWRVGNYGVIADTAERPSLFKPQEYLLEEVSLLPNVPGIPLEAKELPKLPEGVPKLPEIPKIPGLPEIPKIPELPEVPKIPGVPEIPKIPELPEVPKIPGVPRVPEIPGLEDLIPQRVCLVVRCFPSWSRIQICRCIKSRK